MEVEEEKKESVPCSDEEAKGQENQLLKSGSLALYFAKITTR